MVACCSIDFCFPVVPPVFCLVSANRGRAVTITLASVSLTNSPTSLTGMDGGSTLLYAIHRGNKAGLAALGSAGKRDSQACMKSGWGLIQASL